MLQQDYPMDGRAQSNTLAARASGAIKLAGYVLGAIFVLRFLTLASYPLLDRSEARYAFIGELMVQSGNWVTLFVQPDVPFWAKPPFSTWTTAACYLVFGFNAFAARLPSFLIFVGIGWFAYLLGRQERDQEFGLVAAGVFASSALAFYLGGTVMTDPALMLGVTLSMVAFWKCMSAPGRRLWGHLFFVGLAIALLAKGPVGVVLPGLSIAAWVAWQRKWKETWERVPWISGTLLTAALVVPWYWLAEYRTPGFLRYFIVGEHFERFVVSNWKGDLYGAGRPRPLGTIWLYALIAALPWSAIVIAALLRRQTRQAVFRRDLIDDPWLSYLVLWFLAPLILFTPAKNILITYVATALPAFALLTAHALRRMQSTPPAIAVTAAAVPAVLLAGVIAMNVAPQSQYLESQAAIIETYEKAKPAGDFNLTYIFNKPYSADFYSDGRAKLARDDGELDEILRAGNHPYFVVTPEMLTRLSPGTQGRFEMVAEMNEVLLLRAKAGGTP